jgi:hypothetical protein
LSFEPGNQESAMTSRYLIYTAIAALVLSAGCKREEPKPAASPSPPARPQPAEKPPATPSAPGSATSPAEPGRTAGQTVDDAGTTAKVKTALLASPDVKGLDVNVDTVNAKVTLKGSVDSQAQADRAVQIARGIEGVKDVDNQLTVRSKP